MKLLPAGPIPSSSNFMINPGCVWRCGGILVGMDRGEMRAGDADRQAVADRLHGALEEGRLDLHEYDERLQKAYAAKTYADLDGLLDDLPDTIAADRAQLAPYGAGPPSPAPRRGPGPTARWLVYSWEGYLGTVAAVIAIWGVTCLISMEWHYFWPGWVAGPWGALLLVSTLGGLMTGEPHKWAAREEEDRLRDAAKKDK
jgi:Domain of unknown function (DUF1707)